MKIGIIGLRPRQESDLRDRNLELDVTYYGDRAQTRSHIESFVRDRDQVVLMAGHVNRSVIEYVPSEKRYMMTGSVSAVLRHLESFVKKSHKVARASVIQVKPVVDTAPMPVPTAAPVKMAADVPGSNSQYRGPLEHYPTVRPQRDGSYDYSSIKTARPGEAVRFLRPMGLAFAGWRARIAAMRSRFRTEGQGGLKIEAHFFEDFVDLVVMDQSLTPEVASHKPSGFTMPNRPAVERNHAPPPAQPAVTLAAVPSVGNLLAELKQVVPKAEDIKVVEEQRQDVQPTPAPAAPVADEPSPPPAEVEVTKVSEVERQFWRDACIALLAQGTPLDVTIKSADRVLEAYQLRFG